MAAELFGVVESPQTAADGTATLVCQQPIPRSARSADGSRQASQARVQALNAGRHQVIEITSLSFASEGIFIELSVVFI